MICPPTLPVITPEQEARAREALAGIRVHRVEEAWGWSPVIKAYVIGQAWFYFVDDDEAYVIVPVAGSPYTKSPEAWNAYVELSELH